MKPGDSQQMPQTRSVEGLSQVRVNPLPFTQYECAEQNGISMIQGFLEKCSDRRLQIFNPSSNKRQFLLSHGNHIPSVAYGGCTGEPRKCHCIFIVVMARVAKTLKGSEACGKTDLFTGLQGNGVTVYGDNDVLVDGENGVSGNKALRQQFHTGHVRTGTCRRFQDNPFDDGLLLIHGQGPQPGGQKRLRCQQSADQEKGRQQKIRPCNSRAEKGEQQAQGKGQQYG